MHDEEHCPRTDQSQRDPAFFLDCRFVALRQSVLIVERKDRGFEAHTVLQQVPLVLRHVPFKTHGNVRR
jgi:hypothetical protein